METLIEQKLQSMSLCDQDYVIQAQIHTQNLMSGELDSINKALIFFKTLMRFKPDCKDLIPINVLVAFN